jgi:hypothetical protein
MLLSVMFTEQNSIEMLRSGASIPLRPVCVPRHIKTLSKDNGLLELRKYLSEALPITNMNISQVLDQRLVLQHRVT